MMNEQEKSAYILGLKKALEEIETEAVWAGMEWSDRPETWTAVLGALKNAVVGISDQIAMTDGTRETKENHDG